MIRASALVPVAAALSWHEIVDNVNSQEGVMWKAGVPAKFGSPEDVKDFLGAFVPGDAEYEEPEVMEISANAEVPAAFDAATNWPQCAATIANVRDQSACGSCWAFGSVESFEDRACIASGKVVHYSPEDTAFNSNAGMGCNGGNTAWNWFKSTGVVTGGDYTDIGSGDTCLPYSLAPCAHHVPPSAKYPACPGEGPSPRPGRTCSESGYSGAYSGDKMRAASAYSIRGVSQIQTDIMTYGPAYVSFTVYSDFPTYKSGVYHQTSYQQLGGHAVENVGWGTLSGQAYWRIKNSWNEEWGDGGHFKIVRGSNECGIEGGVSAGHVTASVYQEPKQYAKGFVRQPRNEVIPAAEITQEMRDAAPAKLDWSQQGATTSVKDQGSCGSCWAFSATEGIESGVFMTTGSLPAPLSTQQIVACDKADGGCNGGDLPTAFSYVQRAGGIDTNAHYPDTSSSWGLTGQCKAHNNVVKVTGYKYAVPACQGGQCKNQDEDGLKAALNSYGPLSVCVNANSFNSYYGGILKGTCSGAWSALDHCVQLVGYDTTAATPYWKVKNSWANDWGENGFIRLPMGKNSCGIADEAMYVTATQMTQEVV